MSNITCYFISLGLIFFVQKSNCQNTPQTIDCVSSPYISKFRVHDKGSATRYDWKVVAGRDIEYQIKGLSASMWDWELGGSNFWGLISTSTSGDFNKKGKDAQTSIPLPLSNSDFGTTNGLVMATGDGTSTTFQKDGVTEARVEVFFEKDLRNNPDAITPNWFYYWLDEYGEVSSNGMPFFTVDPSSGTVTSGTTLNEVTFNLVFRDDGDWQWRVNPPGTTTPLPINYGSNKIGNWSKKVLMQTVPNPGEACPPLNFRKVMTGYGTVDFTINMGEGAGYEYNSYNYDLPTGMKVGPSNYQGIEGFLAILYHELEHWKIKEELWPDGYDTIDDCETIAGIPGSGDGYPDSWEDTNPTAMIYGFSSTTIDLFTEGYNVSNLSASNSATHYEEVKCRLCEATKNTKLLNTKDWSFDPTNDYQGKRWK